MGCALTGRMMDAVEAERAGLVARVVPADKLLEDALATAETIAGYLSCRWCDAGIINRAFPSRAASTRACCSERRVFHSAFALNDQKEGMAAFVEAQGELRHD